MRKPRTGRFLFWAPFFLLAWSLTGPSARAFDFEWMPEYQTLTETEQSEFEFATRFQAEYSGDLISYLKPPEWDYAWLNSRSALDLMLGSTGAAHFALANRLKLDVPLTEHVDFRFTYFEERNRERDSLHKIIELVFWPWKSLGVSLYGEPELYKRNNDTGIALLLRSQERHEIRIFNTFVDVTRLKRTDRNDNFVPPNLPESRGIVGRIWARPEGESRGDFFQYAFRYDQKTRWLFPDEGYLYTYWKGFGSLYGRKRVAPAIALSARVQFDRKFEAREPNSISARTDRLFSFLRVELGEQGRPHSGFAGLAYASRVWDTNFGDVIYRDFVPHLSWAFPAFGSGDRQDRFSIGYVMNWHRAFGYIPFRDPQDRDAVIEQKLNLSYEFNFAPRGSLILMATGDLDEFFTRRSWDGGAALLRVSL